MKIILKSDNGTEIEIQKLTTFNPDCETILLFSKRVYSKEHKDALERDLTASIGKNVVILDAQFETVVYGTSNETR